jgi:hypothetical protein
MRGWIMSDNLNTQVVGNVGLYFVCYKLSCLGWNVMPTARNARGVDIVIYSQDAKRTLTIQVKSLSKSPPVPLGHSLNKLFGNFFIICRNVATDKPECFILKPEEIEPLAHETVGNDVRKGSFWLQPKEYNLDKFREKWDRIGKGADTEIVSDKALPPKPTQEEMG